jgi:hypothetical protein
VTVERNLTIFVNAVRDLNLLPSTIRVVCEGARARRTKDPELLRRAAAQLRELSPQARQTRISDNFLRHADDWEGIAQAF